MMSPEFYSEVGNLLMWLLTAAWLLPLLGFVIEIFGGYWSDRKSKTPAYLAVGCIGTGFLLSLVALLTWVDAADLNLWHFGDTESAAVAHHEADAAEAGHEDDHSHSHDHADHSNAHGEHGDAHHDGGHHGGHESHANDPFKTAFAGTFYRLGKYGSLDITLDWYIDGLTVAMFAMVTLIATCIHIFAIGYMSDELTERYEDHFVHTEDGGHFHRVGRFYRFFAYLSLFCFAMLGLVLAGNIFQVFIFWELVGVCSYLLIGFYVERKTASTAANKAFIMNRVGDFGFLIGLMILWTWFGVFQFAETNPETVGSTGLFQMVRTADGELETQGEGREKVVVLQAQQGIHKDGGNPHPTIPYFLLVAAGLGIFGGCIGKSAQFPLQTWLPDAMEGPTPVSALVHSATMVAAGVYLVGRFYPMFTPEVLLVIAYTGCITLFVGATIAVVATDIKKVLAYSTISQLGYMMLALGVGGWLAGLFHLITHAFFKSLMFLCSGSVIHGCHHEQEMTKMGGLAKKMPITCWTMFVGVVAISGLAIPFLGIPKLGAIAFSGYHSKDAIVAAGMTFSSLNPIHSLLFFVPLITAGITAFYMFRMWFMTFFGKPKDQHVYDHAHESPRVMTAPLLILAFFAMFCAIGGENGPLAQLILTTEPVHVAEGAMEAGHIGLNLPGHHQIHEFHASAGAVALLVAFGGTILAYLFYGLGIVDTGAMQKQFGGVHEFLREKWMFDELYEWMWVRPTLVVATWAAAFDRCVLDRFLGFLAGMVVAISSWDRRFDEAVVDRLVNAVGEATSSVGRSLRYVQTGRLRQYVMFIAVSVVMLFFVLFAYLPR
ncbi:NADH-quinone oxidoreductase subunit L [Thalassoglobus neptunius]|uniref:NADH-quinone oxidoreductase subunit L n=1 Tax=Thalassoglobus neptunius TaxID=1938619 RepID=A0A5C5X6N3_9PLAN|nr:NADH-quinone oxidoreductase subunit L [Thalassoglobus neptunius]TWT58777.1 NADH-quinone oxidoreductase subunit L [Thalassoglobus neptunius]